MVAAEPAGGSCANGGAAITDGLGDTAFACTGATGAQGGTGQTGATGQPGAPGTGATVTTASNADCPNGGAAITDGTGNTAIACTGTTGPQGTPGTGATVATEPTGANCANGGAAITDGLGDTAFACTGATGAQGGTGQTGATGQPGAPGTGATVTAASNADCPNGGAAITDGSGNTAIACTGTTGPQGTPGTGATVATEPAGANCANGGAKITDGSGNTAFACTGAPGAQGATGQTGATGPQGPQGVNSPMAGGYFFTKNYSGTIAPEAEVPLTTTGTTYGDASDPAPTLATDGGVNLAAGTYVVSYSLTADADGSDEEVEAFLTLGGTEVSGSRIASTQSLGEVALNDTSGTMTITVHTGGGELVLHNGDNLLDFSPLVPAQNFVTGTINVQKVA